MTWSSEMVETLCALRANGVERFEQAWASALREHPPSSRERGPDRPALFAVDGGEEDEPLADFLYRAAGDAWHGRRPILGKLVSALPYFDAVDESRGAVAPHVRMVGRSAA